MEPEDERIWKLMYYMELIEVGRILGIQIVQADELTHQEWTLIPRLIDAKNDWLKRTYKTPPADGQGGD